MPQKLQHIDFYQLTDANTAELAAQLADKCHVVAKKTVIHSSKDHCQSVSRALWVLRDLSFLAHGIDDDDGKDYASIWISSKLDQNQIDADYAILLEGREVPNMADFERIFIIFNGRDESALQQARGQWKALSGQFAGHCRYFAKTETGGWAQAASG